MDSNHSTKAGTIGGTLMSVFCNIHKEDLIKTATLASLGAVVSFLVSVALKALIKWFRKL